MHISWMVEESTVCTGDIRVAETTYHRAVGFTHPDHLRIPIGQPQPIVSIDEHSMSMIQILVTPCRLYLTGRIKYHHRMSPSAKAIDSTLVISRYTPDPSQRQTSW